MSPGQASPSSSTLRGPVRRSYSAAMFGGQLAAATAISLSVIVICTSFSASLTVAGEISGPTSGPVPNAGGAPGVVCCWGSGACAEALCATAAPIKPVDVTVKNCLRDFSIIPPHGIVAAQPKH